MLRRYFLNLKSRHRCATFEVAARTEPEAMVGWMKKGAGQAPSRRQTAEAGLDQSVCLRPGGVIECVFSMLSVRVGALTLACKSQLSEMREAQVHGHLWVHIELQESLTDMRCV